MHPFSKDRNDKLIEGHGNVTYRWVKYFEELLNKQSNDEREIQFIIDNYDINEENSEPSTADIISDTIETLRNGRAPSEDLISAEIFKYDGEKFIQMLHDLIAEI